MVKEQRRNRETLPPIPFPMAHFAGGKLRAHNARFAKEFLDGDPTRRPTLAQILGREGMKMLRERGWQDAATGEERLWELTLPLNGKEYDLEVQWVEDALQLFFQDRTERNARQEELRSAQAWSALTFQGSPTALALLDGGMIIQANSEFAKVFGFPNALEASGRAYEKHIAAKFRPALSGLHQNLISGQLDRGDMEVVLLRSDRTSFPAHEGARVTEHEGRPCLLITVRDLSADKENQHRIDEQIRGWQQSEEVMRLVGHPVSEEEFGRRAVESIMHVLGFEFGLLYTNSDTAEVMKAGVSIGTPDAIATSLGELRSGEGLLGFIQKTREPFTVPLEEYPAHLPHRTVLEAVGVRTIAAIPLTGDEAVHGVLLTGSVRVRVHCDLSVLHRLSGDLGRLFDATMRYASLRDHTSLLEQVVNTLPALFYTLRPTGEIQFVSQGAVEITGYTPADFYRNGDLWRNILHPDDRSLYGNRVAGHADGRHGIELEYRLLPKGKASYRRLHDTVVYLRDAEGTLTAIIGSVRELEEEPASPTPDP